MAVIQTNARLLPSVQSILNQYLVKERTTVTALAMATDKDPSTVSRWAADSKHRPKVLEFRRILSSPLLPMQLRCELFDWFAAPTGFVVTPPDAVEPRQMDCDGSGSVDENDVMACLIAASEKGTAAMRRICESKSRGRGMTPQERAEANQDMRDAEEAHRVGRAALNYVGPTASRRTA